ncbi:MAG: LPS export ABC transporter permease LptG [Deltaproteobacteria bacterium]|jgi:lipopolysaccharide export system permease protein|nr:LPS export ABC transporter permease LptG [Deltaproteobacteria bacterium]
MSTVDRFIKRQFVNHFAVILVSLVSLYALIDFIEKVDDFIEHKATLVHYLLFPVYNLPQMIAHTLPMAILLSAFVSFGSLSRTGQMTALLGGGLSISRVSRPMFSTGLVLSGLMLLGNLWLIPLAVQEGEYLLEAEIKGKRIGAAVEAQDLYFKSGDQIIHIRRSFPHRGELHGIIIFTMNDQFKPIKRLQAKTGDYLQNGTWQFKDVKIWTFADDAKSIAGFESHPVWSLDLKKNPEELAPLWNVPEEMTFGELSEVINRLKSEGHDPTRYQVEKHLRFSRACIPLIMILLGIPFAIKRGRHASYAFGIVISLIIFVVYFILYAVFAALGQSNILPPVVSAWAANLLMTLTGLWMFFKVQD